MKHETIPSVVRDLINGRQRIVEYWGKGNGLFPPRHGHCALTAIGVTGDCEASFRFLRDALPLGEPSIHRYNDAPTTTKQDILDLYDRAIGLALAAHK